MEPVEELQTLDELKTGLVNWHSDHPEIKVEDMLLRLHLINNDILYSFINNRKEYNKQLFKVIKK